MDYLYLKLLPLQHLIFPSSHKWQAGKTERSALSAPFRQKGKMIMKTEISNGSNRFGCRYTLSEMRTLRLQRDMTWRIVRGYHDGDPLAVQRAEQIHYRRAGLLSSAPVGLASIGFLLCNDRPCNGDTLLLPSGKLVHALVLLTRRRPFRATPRLLAKACFAEHQRQHHIEYAPVAYQRESARQADVGIAQCGASAVRKLAHRAAVKRHSPLSNVSSSPINTSNVDLPEPDLPVRQNIRLFYLEVDILQRVKALLAERVVFVQTFDVCIILKLLYPWRVYARTGYCS